MCSAKAQPPTKESVERLVIAANLDDIAVTLQQQAEEMMINMMSQAFPSGSLDPEGQAIMQSYASKMGKRYATELSREKIRAIYVEAYSSVYSQEEVDGQIIFYESKVGRLVVAKNAAVTSASMNLLQQRMAPVMQSIQQSLLEAVEEIKAKTKKG